MIYPYESLPENLAAFCAVLRRDYRFRIGPRELQDAARALEMIDLLDELGVRNVLRPVLTASLDDIRVFDRAFDGFFGGRESASVLRTAGAPDAADREPRLSSADRDTGARVAEGRADERPDDDESQGTVQDVSNEGSESAAGLLRASYSPSEAAGPAPDLVPPDREWRDAAQALVSRVHAGLSRRWRPARHGHRFDFRRTLRSSLHTGGEVLIPRWRARPRRRPRFVLLIDGSRSMGIQAQPALRAAVAIAGVTLNAEAFTFSTALRRVTRDVHRAAAGERRRLQLHHAWGGGTAIGHCLREFLQRFGDRLLGRDTVVVIASDGLDVGDPHVLHDAMARLSRDAAAIVWINPLADTPGYEPTARGMSVARPFVTTLVSLHGPAGLVQLARVIRVR